MSQVIQYRYGSDLYSFNTGGVNATEAAARFGKETHEFLRLPTTKKYIEALEELEGAEGKWVKTQRGTGSRFEAGKSRFKNPDGVADKTPRGGGATWLHPELAVVFAR